MKSLLLFSLALAALLAAAAMPAPAQQPGPMAPLPGKEVKRIPSTPAAEAPPVPAPEIIRQFTAREDEFSRAHASYGFHRSIRLQEFLADGSEGGELDLEQDIFVAPNGKRYEKVTKETTKDLKSSQIEFQDLKELARIPFFPFTTEESSRYTFTYVGLQPLDELNTYVFRIKPKQLERSVRRLEGLIYVDDHDMAVVKVYGRWVGEVEDTPPDRPFALFDIQRENVEGKYWFPDYMRSDAYVPAKQGQTHLRLTIKMTDFRTGAAAAAPPAAAAPVSPPPAAAPQPAAPKPPSR